MAHYHACFLYLSLVLKQSLIDAKNAGFVLDALLTGQALRYYLNTNKKHSKDC